MFAGEVVLSIKNRNPNSKHFYCRKSGLPTDRFFKIKKETPL